MRPEMAIIKPAGRAGRRVPLPVSGEEVIAHVGVVRAAQAVDRAGRLPAGLPGKAFEGGEKPGVEIGGMVEHQIKQQPDLRPVADGGEKPVVLQSAQPGIDCLIIRHVIAVVGGRGRHGRQPQPLGAQRLDIGDLFRDALQVSHAVSVRVVETGHENLVNRAVQGGGCRRPRRRKARPHQGAQQEQRGQPPRHPLTAPPVTPST